MYAEAHSTYDSAMECLTLELEDKKFKLKKVAQDLSKVTKKLQNPKLSPSYGLG